MIQHSDELNSALKFVEDSGVAHFPIAETELTEGSHVAGSYHYRFGTNGKGLALDVDGDDLQAIFDVFAEVGEYLHELIWSDAPQNIKDGKWVPVYDHAPNAKTHIHAAFQVGVFLDQIAKPPAPPVDKGDINMLASDPSGNTWALKPDGAVIGRATSPYWGGLNTKGMQNKQGVHPGVNGHFIGIAYYKNADGSDGYSIGFQSDNQADPSFYDCDRAGNWLHDQNALG